MQDSCQIHDFKEKDVGVRREWLENAAPWAWKRRRHPQEYDN